MGKRKEFYGLDGQRFIETAAQRKRLETGCKPVPAQFESILWAGRGLQPRPPRFIETAAQRKRLETGCKPVPAQFESILWAGRGLQPRPPRFIETTAQRKRLETGCKPAPAQMFYELDGVCNPVRNVLLPL